MKDDSGIEPMMNVPKHWKINKIKYLLNYIEVLNITKKFNRYRYFRNQVMVKFIQNTVFILILRCDVV